MTATCHRIRSLPCVMVGVATSLVSTIDPPNTNYHHTTNVHVHSSDLLIMKGGVVATPLITQGNMLKGWQHVCVQQSSHLLLLPDEVPQSPSPQFLAPPLASHPAFTVLDTAHPTSSIQGCKSICCQNCWGWFATARAAAASRASYPFNRILVSHWLFSPCCCFICHSRASSTPPHSLPTHRVNTGAVGADHCAATAGGIAAADDERAAAAAAAAAAVAFISTATP